MLSPDVAVTVLTEYTDEPVKTVVAAIATDAPTRAMVAANTTMTTARRERPDINDMRFSLATRRGNR